MKNVTFSHFMESVVDNPLVVDQVSGFLSVVLVLGVQGGVEEGRGEGRGIVVALWCCHVVVL